MRHLRSRSSVGAAVAPDFGARAPTPFLDPANAQLAPLVVPALLAPAAPAWERSMNAEQLEVIRHEGGPLLNLAQAGSGKTRALVHRVVRLVEHLGVDPARILCVTFSTKGAGEMNARLAQLGIRGVGATWHSVCGRVLREDCVPAGSWNVDDKDNKFKSFVKQAAGYKHENWVGADTAKIRRFISRCKGDLFEVDSPEAAALAKKEFGGFAQKALRVWTTAQGLVEEAQLLTFDDMIVFAWRHLCVEENRQAWAARFDYVLVDEGQDNNRSQKVLMEMFARDHRNVMIVGDLAQAIFGFRGSTPEYLAGFEADWPGAKRVAMCRNYRSGRAIVACANDVIRPARVRLPEDMVAERDFDGKVEVRGADTLEDEARELVEFVKSHVEGGGKPSDVCVLYRLNAQSRALEEACLREKVPYVIVGGVNFYERKEVKDLLGYLRLAVGKDRDGEALRRCINAPFRFLGAAFVEKVEEERRRDAEAGPEAWVTRAANRDRIQDRQKKAAYDWVRLVESAKREAAGGVEDRRAGLDGDEILQVDVPPAPPFDVLNRVVKATDYIRWLEREEGEETIDASHAANVRELLRVAQSFKTCGEFVDFVDRQVAESTKNKRSGKAEASVTMMTVHRSKGLEWPIVWVVGCNETVFPHIKGDPEEERRLMYVAVTRARDHLVASHVRELATRVGLKTVERSPYLAAFPGQRPETVELLDGSVAEVLDLDPPGDAKEELLDLMEAIVAAPAVIAEEPGDDEPILPVGARAPTLQEQADADQAAFHEELERPNLERLAALVGPGATCGECRRKITDCAC